ncbi:MAG: hypothetical protein IPM56_07580 [Ignavibacteriales bacterium]|nr:MAG: hypothetical protein IPM56_07580 [Ignavibacteriales bacterium]
MSLRNNVLRFRLLFYIYIISLQVFFSLSFHKVQDEESLFDSVTEITTISCEILSPANVENNLREYDGHAAAKICRNVFFFQTEFILNNTANLSNISFEQQVTKDFEKSRFLQFISSHTGLRSPPSVS